MKLGKKNAEYYIMEIVKIVSSRSTCSKISVGAVLVDIKGSINAIGYNGAPSKMNHCKDEGPREVNGHDTRCVHAELNLIANCSKEGISTIGKDIYITHFPCSNCLKVLINAGIINIFYITDYTDETNKAVGKEAMIKDLINIEQVRI